MWHALWRVYRPSNSSIFQVYVRQTWYLFVRNRARILQFVYIPGEMTITANSHVPCFAKTLAPMVLPVTLDYGKVGVDSIMRGSILIILAISLFKSDGKCKYILQNEIDTYKLELYTNNQFILTIEIGRMNICPFAYRIILYILKILHHFPMHWNNAGSQNPLSW